MRSTCLPFYPTISHIPYEPELAKQTSLITLLPTFSTLHCHGKGNATIPTPTILEPA